jgi:hypothetical protein
MQNIYGASECNRPGILDVLHSENTEYIGSQNGIGLGSQNATGPMYLYAATHRNKHVPIYSYAQQKRPSVVSKET